MSKSSVNFATTVPFVYLNLPTSERYDLAAESGAGIIPGISGIPFSLVETKPGDIRTKSIG